MNKKAVITILGTIDCKGDKTNKAQYLINKNLKYLISLKNETYTNMLPILIENFYKKYDIVPIYTDSAKSTQENVLKNCEEFKEVENIIKEIFENGVYIINENNFEDILKRIDEKIREYEEVIVDVSHGFRHLPILMTINLIVTSLKTDSRGKIKNILFAKELERFKKYEIIDLREYLELANLAFIINIFKDNYSVSNHISINDKTYKKLINYMREFSKNLMALSIDKLLFNIVPELKKELNTILNKGHNDDNILMFKNEIKEIIKRLESIYVPKNHRYQTYYYIARDVASEEKGYLAVAVSLIFEGVSFYLYTSFKERNIKLRNFFEQLEKDKNLTTYDILDLCRGIFSFRKEKFKISNKLNKYFSNEVKEEFFNVKSEIYNKKLKDLLFDSRKIRNNLLHANSGGRIEDVNKRVKDLLDRYEKLLMTI